MIKPYVVSFTSTKAFVSALKAAVGVVTKRSSLHAIQSVRLSFNRFEVTVETTDLQLWYRCVLPIEEDVTQPFSVLITKDAAKTIKASTELVFNEAFYTIGSIKYEPLFGDEEFPEFPALSHPVSLSVPAEYFDDLAACATSASESEVRPILTNVCHRGNLLVATDGLRALYATQPVTWERDINVPAINAKLLHKTFGKTGAFMHYDNSYARFAQLGADITVKLNDATYPDMSRILPNSSKSAAVIDDVTDWLAACDTALKLHKQAEKGNRDHNKTLRLSFGANMATVSAQISGGPTFSTDIALKESSSKVSIAVNAQFFRDALESLGSGAEIHFNGPDKPILLTGDRRKALVSPVFKR